VACTLKARSHTKKDEERKMGKKRGCLLISLLVAASPGFGLAAGPDVIVGFVDGGREAVRNTVDGKILIGLTANTNSCNAGDAALDWFRVPDSRHPVISLNLYRILDGRMQQLAASWVKHGYFATNKNQCVGITGIQKKCDALFGGQRLLPGCSDLYGADINDDPANLGPRSKIDPSTGKFDGPTAKDTTGYPDNNDKEINRIMSVFEEDLLRTDAKYFLEAHYITADDAAAGNSRNNVTYREVIPQILGGTWSLKNASPETRGEPAISEWKNDGAELSEIQTEEASGTKGYLFVGSKVTPLSSGRYRYDYVIYNMNSDTGVQSISIPAQNPAEIGFSDAAPKTEIWSTKPWKQNVGNGQITWATDSWSDDKNANAVRWGTAYNFWFTAGTAPQRATATLTRFKPSAASTLTTAVLVPSAS
jgi:hypothetical protein